MAAPPPTRWRAWLPTLRLAFVALGVLVAWIEAGAVKVPATVGLLLFALHELWPSLTQVPQRDGDCDQRVAPAGSGAGAAKTLIAHYPRDAKVLDHSFVRIDWEHERDPRRDRMAEAFRDWLGTLAWRLRRRRLHPRPAVDPRVRTRKLHRGARTPEEVELGRFLPLLRTAGRYEWRLWSVPFNTDAALLYYRSDLLSQARLRPPRTWAELWRQARTLLSVEGTGLTGGYAAQLAPYEGLTVNALELVWGAGGDVVDGRGNVTVDRTPGRRALQQLIADLGGERPLIPRAALDHHEDGSIRAFESGAVVFMRNWPYAYGTLANNPDMRGRFGVTTLPGAGVLGGQNLAVAESSPEKAAALSLIAHLTGVETQRRLFTCGGFAPVRGEVYEAPGKCPDQLTTPERDRIVRHVPDTSMLRRAVEKARPRPARPYYTEFSRTLQRRLHERLQCLDLSVCNRSADLEIFTDSLADDLRRSLRSH